MQKAYLLYHDTLFNQTRKYCNQNNKILHLTSHMALQAAPLIGTTTVPRNLSVSCDYGAMEPSNSVPGSADRHAQLLTAGKFKII